MTRGYCMICKKRVDIKNAKEILVNGKKETKGKCPFCGLTIYIIEKIEEEKSK